MQQFCVLYVKLSKVNLLLPLFETFLYVPIGNVSSKVKIRNAMTVFILYKNTVTWVTLCQAMTWHNTENARNQFWKCKKEQKRLWKQKCSKVGKSEIGTKWQDKDWREREREDMNRGKQSRIGSLEIMFLKRLNKMNSERSEISIRKANWRKKNTITRVLSLSPWNLPSVVPY